MNLFEDDRIPTPEECIQEFTYRIQLQKLEEECEQRKVTVDSLRSIEQTLRKSIIQLSGTLSQLYALSGSLAKSRMLQDEE